MGRGSSFPVRSFQYVLVMILIFLGTIPVYCQKDFRIKKMIREYGMILQGSIQGVEKGDRFFVKRRDGQMLQDIGEGEIVEVLEDRSAIKLTEGSVDSLQVGDLVFESETESRQYMESYRGLFWGIGTDDLSDLEYVTTHPDYGGIEIYTKKGDDLTFGSVPVETIEYQFWQSKLSCIRMMVKGYNTFIRLKNVCFKEFGPGTQSNPNSDDFIWTGDFTLRQLHYYAIPDQGILWISSIESVRLQQEYAAREEMLK